MKKNFRRRAGNADCKIETSIRKIVNRRRQEKFPLISNNSQVSPILNKCLSDESLFLSISNDSLTSECAKSPLKPTNSKQVVEITGIDSRFPKKKPKNSEFSAKIKNSNFRLENNFKKWKSSPDIFLDGVIGESAAAADEKGDEIPLIGYLKEELPKNHEKIEENQEKIQSNCNLKGKFLGNCGKSQENEGLAKNTKRVRKNDGKIPLICDLGEELLKNHKKIEENEEKIQLNCNLTGKFLGNCEKNGENGKLPEKPQEIRENDGKIPLICDSKEKLPKNLKKIEENEKIPLICNLKEKLSKNRKKIGENEELPKNPKEIRENDEKIQLIYNSEKEMPKNCGRIEENEGKIRLIYNSKEKLCKNHEKIEENEGKIQLIYNSEEKLPENCGRIEENEGKIPLICNLDKKLCKNHKKIEENEGKIQLIYNSKEKIPENCEKNEENEGKIPLIYNLDEKLCKNHKKIEENEEKMQLIYNSEEKIPENCEKNEENGGKIPLICNLERKLCKNHRKIEENCEKIEENEDFEVESEPEEAQDDEEVKGNRKLEEFCLRHLQRSKALEPIDDFQPKKNHLLLKKVTIDELQQKFNDIRARLDQQPCDYVIKEDLPRKFSGCPCKMKSGRPRKVSFHVPPENQVDLSKKKVLSRSLGPPKRRIDECEREYFCKEIVSVRKNLRTVRNRLLSRVSSVQANCEELILKRDEDWEIDGAIYDDARGIMFPKETRKAMTVIQYIQRNYSEKLTKGEIK